MAILSQPDSVSYIQTCFPFIFEAPTGVYRNVTIYRDGVDISNLLYQSVNGQIYVDVASILMQSFTNSGDVVNGVVITETQSNISIVTYGIASVNFIAQTGPAGTGSILTVLQRPDNYVFAQDCKDLILQTQLDTSISIAKDGIPVLAETYSPFDNQIIIKLKDVLKQLLYPSVPNAPLFVQTTQISNISIILPTETITFKAIAGGRGTSENPATFLLNNFLTNRPQITAIDRKTPIFLSYTRTEITEITIKGYKPDGSIEYKSQQLSNNQLYTVKYDYYSLLAILNVPHLIAVDFYVTIGDQLFTYSNPIRFLFSRQSLPHDDIFLFENALGSMEAIVFEGLMEETQAHKSVSYKINEVTSEYRNDFSRSFKKNTGIFKNEAHRLWASEFFSSKKRYHKILDGSYKEIFVTSIDAKSVKLDMNDFSFDFSYSEDSRHREVSRINTLPAIVITPVLNNPGDTQDPGLPDT